MVTVGMLMTANQVALGEERTVQAMALWQGSSEVFAVAPEKLMILGSFAGIMYLQGTQSALDAVVILCPAVQNPGHKGEARRSQWALYPHGCVRMFC
jgi:hypothetical protein